MSGNKQLDARVDQSAAVWLGSPQIRLDYYQSWDWLRHNPRRSTKYSVESGEATDKKSSRSFVADDVDDISKQISRDTPPGRHAIDKKRGTKRGGRQQISKKR